MKIKQDKIPLSLFQDTEPQWYLVRQRDNLIKESSKLRFLEFNEDGTFKDQHNEIKVGYSILLGSPPFHAWQTTEIVEIEESEENYYKFKTKNSSYVLFKEEGDMVTQKKLKKAYHECMVELFKKATPSVDYNELHIDEDFNYDAYYLEKNKYEEIVDKYKKKYNIINKRQISAFNMSIYLGHGPTSNLEAHKKYKDGE